MGANITITALMLNEALAMYKIMFGKSQDGHGDKRQFP
jgi:hypothetical protein